MIEFEINDSQVFQMLSGLFEHAEHLPMHDIADILVASVHENFEQQGRPEPWEPRLDDNPWPILHHTGALESSIHALVTGDSVEVTHDTDYGDYLNEGTSRMPAREFLLIQDEDIDAIEDLILNHLLPE